LNVNVVKLDNIGKPVLDLIVVYMPVIWSPDRSADRTVRTCCCALVEEDVVVVVVLVDDDDDVVLLLAAVVSKAATSVAK
jgi:hypothetical protein